MKVLSTLAVACILVSMAPSLVIAVGVDEGEVKGDIPEEDSDEGYTCPTPDDFNLIDKNCSANDVCGGAEEWPIRSTATSTGNVGGSGDPADWSTVEVYRNEELVVEGTVAEDDNGFAIETGFGCTTEVGASRFALHNGWYDIKVRSRVHTPYSLTFHIVANDGRSGKDAGSTPGDAVFISALPRTLDPTRSVEHKGSIPNREIPLVGPEKDHDLYRIGTSLAALSDPTNTEGPAIGLLTVTAHIDCNGGDYTFGFYGPDGLTPIYEKEGCGPIETSCITSGVFPAHAMFGTTRDRGTGYRFNADLIPLYLVDLDDGIPRPYLTPSAPFCDILTPTVLEATEWSPGTNVGFVNADGLVLASTHVH